MKSKNTLKKRITPLVCILAMVFALFSAQAFAADLGTEGTTANVSTAEEFKAALENTNVDKIIFQSDISIGRNQKKIAIATNRANSNLEIDGNNHTLTEYFVKGQDYINGIEITRAGTLKELTVKNLNIVGGSVYGTFKVADTITDFTQNFENTIYNGPRMVYNKNGNLKIDNSEVNIDVAQGSGRLAGQVAVASNINLAGIVQITKQTEVDNAYEEVFYLPKGGSVNIEENANVNVQVLEPKSGVIYAGGKYDLNIGSGAVFSCSASHQFEKTYWMRNFTMGEAAVFDVAINGDLLNPVIKASYGNVDIGSGSAINIDVAGNASDQIMYANDDMNIQDNAAVDINVQGEVKAYIVKSLSGDIAVGDSARLSVNVGAVHFKVVEAFSGSIIIHKNALAEVFSNGNIKHPLMYAASGLVVDENARLDLVALNNNNPLLNYVLSIQDKGKLEFYKPEQVLVYNNGNREHSLAIDMGAKNDVDIDVYSTKYWNNAVSSGGYDVLENEDIGWVQSIGDNYRIDSYITHAGSFSSFNVEDYHNGIIDPQQYYFSKPNNYGVCLWNGSGEIIPVEYTLTYHVNNPYHKDDVRYSDPEFAQEQAVGGTFQEGTQVPLLNYNEVFDYDEHEFVGWSTTGNASDLIDSDSLTLDEDKIVYAVYKSCAPNRGEVSTSARDITGLGIAGSDIIVNFDNRDVVILDTIVMDRRMWVINVPDGIQFRDYDYIFVYQQEKHERGGKIISDPDKIIIPEGA